MYDSLSTQDRRAASNLQNPYQILTYLTMAGGWVYFD